MKKTELIKILKFLNSYYQHRFEYPKDTKEDTKMMNATWFMFLEDYEYKLVTTALKKMVIDLEYPPTPGDIVKAVEEMKRPAEIPALEAWSEVLKSIRLHGTTYGYKETKERIREKTNEKTLEIIKGLGGLDSIGMAGEGDSYLRNSFIKAYESMQEQEKKQNYLPPSIKKEVEQIESPSTPQIEEKGDK